MHRLTELEFICDFTLTKTFLAIAVRFARSGLASKD